MPFDQFNKSNILQTLRSLTLAALTLLAAP